MKKSLCTLLTALSFMLFSHVSNATVHMVLVSNYVFTPTNLTFQIGDTIMWMRLNGSHTTTSTSIPGGAASWDAVLDSVSTSYTYVPTVQGVYNYQCTPHAAMGMVGSFTVIGLTSVPNINNLPGWNIYPNPVSTTLFLRAPEMVTQAELYDANGRVVWSEKNKSNSMDIDVSPVPFGYYFLHIVTENKENFVRTIVIMH
ncbi:T9SS type A sorting domain-containing protein [Chitinophagaceae bacterium MMS25-I14]